MEKVIISAKEGERGVWRLTQNGKVLGDSKGFERREVAAAIRAQVSEMRGYRYPVDAVEDAELMAWLSSEATRGYRH